MFLVFRKLAEWSVEDAEISGYLVEGRGMALTVLPASSLFGCIV